MKTFIYLPLIALIILTGCKSSSFTTQRYTKFGHSSHKKSSHDEVVVNKENKATETVETETVRSTETPVQMIASGFSSLKENIIKPQRKVYSLNSNASVIDNTTTESVSKNETVNTNNSKSEIKSQKTVKEKKQAREGVIGSALEAAIWIVLVVIFIILILFLLAVIF